MSPKRPSTRLICPLISPTIHQMRAEMATAASLGAEMLELRLDYLQDVPTAENLHALLDDTPLEVIVTCRPERQGGKFRGDETQRLAILEASAQYEPAYIDIEMDVPADRAPRTRTIRSHHDLAGWPRDIDAIAAELEQTDAAVTKLAFAAQGPQDALRALDLLRSASKPRIALAMGEAGLVSRILAKKLGAFGTFAALSGGAESAPGQPTLEEMKNLYRWDDIGPDTQVYGVIGCPVAHSLSPAIHNAAFAAVGIDAVYLPLLVPDGPEHFAAFMDALRERPWLDWRGLSVTIPHKQNALAYIGAENCDELAARIGAVNTITIDPTGRVRGDNTDYSAAIDALCSAMGIERNGLAGVRVAVLGAGGVARAIVAGLRHCGAAVTIYNRTLSRAEDIARQFDCQAAPLHEAQSANARVLINCTSLGMWPNVETSPVERIPPGIEVVFDTIYNPLRTRLLSQAQRAGCVCVDGLEMFVNQAASQFEIWTGRTAPRDVMRRIVTQRLADAAEG